MRGRLIGHLVAGLACVSRAVDRSICAAIDHKHRLDAADRRRSRARRRARAAAAKDTVR